MRPFINILSIAFIIFTLSGCYSDNYRIKGTITNGDNRTLILEKMQLDRDLAIDSVHLDEDGSFSFHGEKLNIPTFFKLKLSENNYITLLLDSTEHVTVTADAKNLENSYRLEGSIESKKVQILNERLKTLRSTVDSLLDVYDSLPAEGDTQRKNEIGQQLLIALDEHKSFVGSFVMDNPRSFASYYALFQRLSDNTMVLNVMDKKEQVYFATIATSLNLMYPESPRVKQLYNYVLSAKAQERRQRITQELQENAEETIPEIKEKNIHGEEVALSSLKGKVVLLSFWASWDEASRRANDHMKKVYQQYKDQGFEIYQVSLDRSKILWENAVVKDELPWINVSDLRYTDSFPARIYNVNQLPANYLISRDGDIIGKNLFGHLLEEKVKEAL
ncbi:AhpC/TSA family protein [Marinilabilia salmonicolor]|uniref:Peroxiredoxin n=1 Tax=Marinilabilia salmonicolor TaxID=989 RepID=A0A2T0XQQ4_9BACT|nr:AhpC/TSA family protein [Marinilabilia salmonicolor]PRZ01237.1 peroxiredoxin [Marinilabilia salmonicolor]RCW39367.1 peroxiredoxin [Marinilabilia salmonicolor]